MRLWCDEQITVMVDGPGGRYEALVPTPWARIGAHPQSDVPLSGPGVAKRAFYLHAASAGLYALSLDLQNIDLKQRGRWLLPGDVLTVGEYRLTARLASGLTTRSGLTSLVERGSVQPPLPVLNIHCGGLLKDKRRFRSRLSLLGRRPQCSLQLKGAQVSSFHCALYWEQRRLWCIDLLSSNGTKHNGAPLDCEEFLLHDRLGVGEFELEYHRWSPRRSMVPGWDPATDPEPASEEPQSSSDALSDIGTVTGASQAATESSIIDAAAGSDSKLGLHFAAEVALLASERREMQEQWTTAAERLASQISALHAEIQKLSQERESLEAARAQWQSERLAIAQELADRNGHLARLEADLVAATSMLGQRSPQVELHADSLPQARLFENEPALPPSPVHETAGSMPGPAAVDSGSYAELPLDAGPPASQHDARLIAALTDSTSPLQIDLESHSNPAGQKESLAAIPVGRRGKAGRDEMSAFVRDRLRDIESTKRRKTLVLWATIGAAALTISAAIWGALVWLY